MGSPKFVVWAGFHLKNSLYGVTKTLEGFGVTICGLFLAVYWGHLILVICVGSSFLIKISIYGPLFANYWGFTTNQWFFIKFSNKCLISLNNCCFSPKCRVLLVFRNQQQGFTKKLMILKKNSHILGKNDGFQCSN